MKLFLSIYQSITKWERKTYENREISDFLNIWEIIMTFENLLKIIRFYTNRK